MDDSKVPKVRQKVKEELRLGRVRLASLKEEKQLLAQNNQDREQLFAFFKLQGLEKELELNEVLLRLLMNYSTLASYRGVREGFKIYEYAAELREDRARLHLFEYLRKNPKAANQELVTYLDTKNGRLSKLKTKRDDPHWAPLPVEWKERLVKDRVSLKDDSFWETALEQLPTLVMPFLSRIKRMANEVTVKNVLYNWPEIFKRHKKERK